VPRYELPFVKPQASRLRRVEEALVGKLGEVVVRIRGGALPGEIVLIVDGAPELYLALAQTELAVGRRVLVVHDRGDRTVDVEAWDVMAPDWSASL
jgi:membrane protein implicated in regulation of membrane protease activity